MLSEDGAIWELVGASVRENGTVAHIEQVLAVAKDAATPSRITARLLLADHAWQFGGTLEKGRHELRR